MKKLMMMLACVLLTCSCRQTANKQGAVTAEEGDTARVVLKYAQGFKVDERDGFRLLTVTDPQREDSTQTREYRFALVPRGTKPQDVPADCRVIETPVRGLICMTTLQLGGFIKLGALDHVVGIASAKRLFDKELKARLDDGRIQKIGKEGNFDEEMVIGTRENMDFYGLPLHDFDVLDIGDIPERFHDIDAVCTDPPYGRSTKTGGEQISEIYARAEQSLPKVLRSGGRAVVVLPYELAFRTMELEGVYLQRVHGSLSRHYHVFRAP
jgi:hypothetical protein